MNAAPYAFRIVGTCHESRRLVEAAAALTAYAACDSRAQVERESYLSAFQFGAEFRQHLEATGATKDYRGPCWAPWLWFDIDREGDIEGARRDAARLCLTLIERYQLDEDQLPVFLSGGKGFHLGLPTTLWRPEPSDWFDRHAKQLAETLATSAQVRIDCGVYDKVRAFRAPNSRHPKTGLHKRLLSLGQLMHFKAEAIAELAKAPAPFTWPELPAICERAKADWQAAVAAVSDRQATIAERRQHGAPAALNRSTLAFIRDGADAGDRHRLLFSAAANLAEFGCPCELAHALLTEAALDSGLAPKEARRQIDCGLTHKGGTP
jgi:hypothetical protein